MNFVFVSPNFPRRYYKWVEALRERGITVLGIGDSPTYDLHPRLKASLNEYYFLPDLSDFPKMKEAVAYYERKYGKIDYIESDNEWWLEMDARLREAFGVFAHGLPELLLETLPDDEHDLVKPGVCGVINRIVQQRLLVRPQQSQLFQTPEAGAHSGCHD